MIKMKTNEHQLFLDGDSGHAYENELFPNQYSDYPIAADGTGDGDPEWQKEYEKYKLEHSQESLITMKPIIQKAI